MNRTKTKAILATAAAIAAALVAFDLIPASVANLVASIAAAAA